MELLNRRRPRQLGIADIEADTNLSRPVEQRSDGRVWHRPFEMVVERLVFEDPSRKERREGELGENHQLRALAGGLIQQRNHAGQRVRPGCRRAGSVPSGRRRRGRYGSIVPPICAPCRTIRRNAAGCAHWKKGSFGESGAGFAICPHAARYDILAKTITGAYRATMHEPAPAGDPAGDIRHHTTVAAAEELALSQPAISNALKAMEAQAGFTCSSASTTDCFRRRGNDAL